ncbi:hypothetical protein ABFX02_08G097200 [Erythranthe guttata]
MQLERSEYITNVEKDERYDKAWKHGRMATWKLFLAVLCGFIVYGIVKFVREALIIHSSRHQYNVTDIVMGFIFGICLVTITTILIISAIFDCRKVFYGITSDEVSTSPIV